MGGDKSFDYIFNDCTKAHEQERLKAVQTAINLQCPFFLLFSHAVPGMWIVCLDVLVLIFWTEFSKKNKNSYVQNVNFFVMF